MVFDSASLTARVPMVSVDYFGFFFNSLFIFNYFNSLLSLCLSSQLNDLRRYFLMPVFMATSDFSTISLSLKIFG